MDLLGAVGARARTSAATIKALSEMLRWYRIEQYERPSVDGAAGANEKCLQFQRVFEEHSHRIFATSGANQSSKTVTVAGLCFCKHIRDRARDGDVYWVIAQSAETMRDIPHKMLWEFLPRSMFPQGIEYAPRLGFGLISTLHLHLPDGRGRCEVWFKSEEQEMRSFESSRVNGIWWTECKRELIFDALQPRTAARRGWVLMDYVPVEAWHKRRLRLEAERGNPAIYHMRFAMQDNAQNLAPGEIDNQRRIMTEREARVRIDGEDGSEEGAVYMEFDLKYHECEPFHIPSDWPRYRCLDYGYRHPTACLWVALAPDNWIVPKGKDWTRSLLPNQERVIVYREYFMHGQTVPDIAGAIRAMSEGERYRHQGLVTADPSMWNITQVHGAKGTSIADEFAKAGLPLRKAPRTQGVGEHAQVAKIRWWFEHDKILMFSTCKNAVANHQDWRYKKNKDGAAPGNEPFEDSNNDACDALRYLLAENITFHQPKATVRRTAA